MNDWAHSTASTNRAVSKVSPRGRRLLAAAAAIAVAMLATVLQAGGAAAATAPSGYLTTSGWTASGSTATATLPAPYTGTLTATAGPGQTVITDSVGAIMYPTDPSTYAGCLNGHSGLNGQDNFATCTTYTSTLTFSTPVTNPVIHLDLGGGLWTGGDGSCSADWQNVTFTSVNGGAPSGVTLASTLDPNLTWDGSTLAINPATVTSCNTPTGGPEYFQVSGTVTSVTFTYTLVAKTVQYFGNGQIGLSATGGITTNVLLPPITSDMAVTKTATPAVQTGQVITWNVTATNNGPDPAPSWTVTDPIPAGITGAATTTPGCSISAGTMTCTGTNLAVGASTTITMTGTATTAGTVTNTASVSTTATDSVSSNNSASASTTVTDAIPVPLVNLPVLAGSVVLLPLGFLGLRRLRRANTAD